MAERFAQPEEQARRLTAFADGELPAAEAAAVQAHLAAHPADAARAAAAARFRQGVAAAFLAKTPSPSDALRERVAAIAGQESGDDEARSVPMPRRHARWFAVARPALAALILLALGVVVGRMLWGPKSVGVNPLPVPASTVAFVTHVHVDCSRAPDLHTAAFPKRLGTLESRLKEYLGRPVPYPDLRPIGYEYVGAGPCGNRAEQTVHLLYKAISGPVTDTVSLFVQPYHGQVHIEEGQVYWAAGRDAAHPMIVWRKDEMVFYLVGDADQPVEKAAGLMHVPVPSL
jgi:anti-sigma factor RsiW